MDINALNFNAQGLIPAIVRDYNTGEVLMLAYMNRESLEISLKEKRTCFYSRSRRELWRKGETSGNVQHIVGISADCEYNSLLVEVIKDGPACHTGSERCFINPVYTDADAPPPFSLEALYGLLENRNRERPEGSYTTYLFEKGREKILKKVGEECAEVIIGAMKGSRDETVYEIADLCYHTLVLMTEMGIPPGAILKELEARHVVDKKTKQETV